MLYLELWNPIDGFEWSQNSQNPQGFDGVQVLTSRTTIPGTETCKGLLIPCDAHTKQAELQKDCLSIGVEILEWKTAQWVEVSEKSKCGVKFEKDRCAQMFYKNTLETHCQTESSITKFKTALIFCWLLSAGQIENALKTFLK